MDTLVKSYTTSLDACSRLVECSGRNDMEPPPCQLQPMHRFGKGLVPSAIAQSAALLLYRDYNLGLWL